MDVDNTESAMSAYHTAERKKSNLAFAFFCLDKERATDMEIFYAFCRLMDDIADEEGNPPEVKREALNHWKREIASIYEGAKELSPLAKEMRQVINRRKIPQQYLQDIIDGVSRDTFDKPFETFDDIRQYCYGVASAVGLASIYIFGFKNARTKEFAVSLGYALQFTNILRDVVDDYRSHGRVYIPTKELEAFGVKPQDLENPAQNPHCKNLFRFMHFRAKHFFNKARRLLAPEDKKSLAPALIMWAIYEKILDSLAAMDFNIPAKPFKLSKFQKISLALKAIKDSKKPSSQRKFGKVSVIGGGVAGTCAAIKLALDGFDVSVYEARAELGGRASAIEFAAAKLDNGSHAAMGCYDNFFGALKILGTNGENYFKPVSGMDFIFGANDAFSIKYPPRDSGTLTQLFSFLSYRKLKGFSSFANLLLLFKLKFGFAIPQANETAINYLSRHNISDTAIETFWRPFCISALNTSLEDSNAKLMTDTIRKCVLKGGDSALLYLPQQPIANALAPAKIYIEGVGGRVQLSEKVESICADSKKIFAISTNKCDMAACDYLVSAIDAKSLARLLGNNNSFCEKISRIKNTDILNIYFTASKQLVPNGYACLVNSPIHWIFEHSSKLPPSDNKFLFGATVSASTINASNEEIEKLLRGEIKKYFGTDCVLQILPMRFKGATIAADCASEQSRPHTDDAKQYYDNLILCGDWIQSNLPCTMESAAKSATLALAKL